MKCIAMISALLCLQLCCAQTETKKRPWPTVLKGKGYAKVIMPANKVAPFIYTTKSYRFISERKISKTQISKFAATAESIASAVARVPLTLSAPPSDEQKPAIYIFSNEESYIKAGGAMASSGYYSGKNDAVYLRGDKFLKARKPNYRLLTHELVHLNMDTILGYTRAWFSEGNAEYFASAFYGTSSYNFSDMSRSIKSRAKEFYPPEVTIELPPLADFVKLDFKQWRALNQKLDAEDRYTTYLTSLLLVHYFYHIAPDGREKIQRYLDATHARVGKKRPSLEDQSHLFADDDIPRIQTKITNYWKKTGLKVKFQ